VNDPAFSELLWRKSITTIITSPSLSSPPLFGTTHELVMETRLGFFLNRLQTHRPDANPYDRKKTKNR
jgi:hypothetical protein